jgi:hypothetical protein
MKKVKRSRKEKGKETGKSKTYLYEYYIHEGVIKLAKRPEDVVGKPLPEPVASIYGFLIDRKRYLEKYDTTPEVLRELTIYIAHIEHLIFHGK